MSKSLERQLVERLLKIPKGRRVDEVRAWYNETVQTASVRAVRRACVLSEIVELVGGSNVDNSINTYGPVFGQVGGQGNQFNAGDINAFNQAVDQSTKIATELRESLKGARQAIDSLALDDESKSILIQNLGNLTVELGQAKPNKTKMEILWGGIKSVVSNVKPFIELGALLGKLYFGTP